MKKRITESIIVLVLSTIFVFALPACNENTGQDPRWVPSVESSTYLVVAEEDCSADLYYKIFPSDRYIDLADFERTHYQDGYYQKAAVRFIALPRELNSGKTDDSVVPLVDREYVVLQEISDIDLVPDRFVGWGECEFAANMSLIESGWSKWDGLWHTRITGGSPIRLRFPESIFAQDESYIDVYVLIEYSEPTMLREGGGPNHFIMQAGNSNYLPPEEVEARIAAVPPTKTVALGETYQSVWYKKQNGKIVLQNTCQDVVNYVRGEE